MLLHLESSLLKVGAKSTVHLGKNRLVTDGLYAYVRILSTPGCLLHCSVRVVHGPTLFSIGLFPVIVLYTWLARREERHMFEEFGKDYLLTNSKCQCLFLNGVNGVNLPPPHELKAISIQDKALIHTNP